MSDIRTNLCNALSFDTFSIVIDLACCSFQEGLILVGGNAMSEVSINLNTLAAKQQSIVGIPRGTVDQVQELVNAVADQKVNELD